MDNSKTLSNITLKNGGTIQGAEQLVGLAPNSPLEQRHPKEPSEHAILLSAGVEVPCVVDGQVVRILIQPFKFADLENVIEAVTPIYSKLNKLAETRNEIFDMVKDSKNLLIFLKNNKGNIYSFMAAFHPELNKEFVDSLTIDSVAELLLTIVTVNIDFFIQEASPKLHETLQKLIVQVIPRLGKITTE